MEAKKMIAYRPSADSAVYLNKLKKANPYVSMSQIVDSLVTYAGKSLRGKTVLVKLKTEIEEQS